MNDGHQTELSPLKTRWKRPRQTLIKSISIKGPAEMCEQWAGSCVREAEAEGERERESTGSRRKGSPWWTIGAKLTSPVNACKHHQPAPPSRDILLHCNWLNLCPVLGAGHLAFGEKTGHPEAPSSITYPPSSKPAFSPPTVDPLWINFIVFQAWPIILCNCPYLWRISDFKFFCASPEAQTSFCQEKLTARCLTIRFWTGSLISGLLVEVWPIWVCTWGQLGSYE